MPLRTCAKGHQYQVNALWARPSNDGLCSTCKEAAASARFHKSEKGRAAVARYRQSEKGKATWRKQGERRRALRGLGGHPNPATDGRLKTGHQE